MKSSLTPIKCCMQYAVTPRKYYDLSDKHSLVKSSLKAGACYFCFVCFVLLIPFNCVGTILFSIRTRHFSYFGEDPPGEFISTHEWLPGIFLT